MLFVAIALASALALAYALALVVALAPNITWLIQLVFRVSRRKGPTHPQVTRELIFLLAYQVFLHVFCSFEQNPAEKSGQKKYDFHASHVGV